MPLSQAVSMHSTRSPEPVSEPRVHKTILSECLSARYLKLPLLLIGDTILASLSTLRPPKRATVKNFNVLYSLSISRINEGSQVNTVPAFSSPLLHFSRCHLSLLLSQLTSFLLKEACKASA